LTTRRSQTEPLPKITPLVGGGNSCENARAMSEPKQNYKWPWFVLAAFVAAVALAVLWMSFAVHRERQERDFNAPLPGAAPH